AMGISEVTDSLTVIVSEETGGISTTMNGKMQQELSLSDLRAYLEKTFEKQESKQTLWIFPKRGRKK
ncbi:MAG: diadenylate cyclase, partial [Brochothrix sp.]